jgi:hypothetical protein
MTRYLALALSALAITVHAQTPPTQPSSKPPANAHTTPVVELTNPANGAKISLKKGGELKLMLDADPRNSTHWVNEGNVGPALSPIGDRIMVSKSVNVADYTAGAWNIFRYRAERPGKVSLQFEARRYDVPGPATRTVIYEVTVE